MDMLSSIGIKPDGIVGHSLGEVGCGYADGCLTAEEAVLAAFLRGFFVQADKPSYNYYMFSNGSLVTCWVFNSDYFRWL